MNETINVFILDDEKDFGIKLKRVVENYFAEQKVDVSVCAFSEKGDLLDRLSTCTPDLLVSDILLESDDYTGIDVAGEVKRTVPACEIIYLTSFLSYATEIYETEPLYFVLKEKMESQLAKALDFFVKKRKKRQQYIRLYINRELTAIKTEEILYCEHEGKRTNIVCKDTSYSVRISMKDLREMLDSAIFAFTHSGFIVNLACVKSHTRTEVTLKNGAVIPIGRSHLDHFKSAYARYLMA